ncbi:hypothetical protein CEXT_509201 [Caerostris extrusa]|uniref:Uncharacterized protein n=1 Tax=Caerostris extrusa TaxID=172846 RepID=A0AAV4WTE8_CAEEX|nr:hypothetical protein CEXT_509201 [Caerostris extrusa]
MFAPCQHISSFYQLPPLQQLVYRNRTTALENAVKGSINLIGENNSKYFLLFSSAASPPIELQWADFTVNRERGRCTSAIISRRMFAPCEHISSFYQLSPLQQLVYRNRTTAVENAVKGSINLIGENNSKYFPLLSSAASPPIELQWADFTLK